MPCVGEPAASSRSSTDSLRPCRLPTYLTSPAPFDSASFPGWFLDYSSTGSSIVNGFPGRYYIDSVSCGGAHIAIANDVGRFLTNIGTAIVWRDFDQTASMSCWEPRAPNNHCSSSLDWLPEPGAPSDLRLYKQLMSKFDGRFLNHRWFKMVAWELVMDGNNLAGDFCWRLYADAASIPSPGPNPKPLPIMPPPPRCEHVCLPGSHSRMRQFVAAVLQLPPLPLLPMPPMPLPPLLLMLMPAAAAVPPPHQIKCARAPNKPSVLLLLATAAAAAGAAPAAAAALPHPQKSKAGSPWAQHH